MGAVAPLDVLAPLQDKNYAFPQQAKKGAERAGDIIRRGYRWNLILPRIRAVPVPSISQKKPPTVDSTKTSQATLHSSLRSQRICSPLDFLSKTADWRTSTPIRLPDSSPFRRLVARQRRRDLQAFDERVSSTSVRNSQ